MDIINILWMLDKVCHRIYQVVVEVYISIYIYSIYNYLNRDSSNSMYLRNCTEQEIVKKF